MRPVRLEVRGFTAFRDPQEIDFDGMDLFALWGPTGSGKSSLLDAITYALYGKVDRVSHASELISQGQPRMAVVLTFALADRLYRIARSTTPKGGTKVLLEELRGPEWKSCGEGSDKARAATAAITELIGMDYTAFTRSVLLPQGKFAEFLVGDPADRRKILTELLGLELFGRMAGIANNVARDARATAEARAALIESEFAGVDEGALQIARDEARSIKKLVKKAGEIEASLEKSVARWQESERALAAIVECAEEIAGIGDAIGAETDALSAIAVRMKTSDKTVAEARTAAEASARAADAAAAKRAAAEKEWGPAEQLVALREVAGRAEAAAREVERATLAVEATAGRRDEARAALKEATSVLDAAAVAADAAAHALAEAETRLAQAQRADLVGTLTHGLEAGAPCPVCERPLERLPDVSPAGLAAAEKDIAEVRSLEAAEKAKTDAAAGAASAAAIVKEVEARLKESETESRRRTRDLEEATRLLAQGFGGSLPDDPLELLGTRISSLRALIESERTAGEERDAAAETLRRAEAAGAELRAEVRARRAALAATKIDPALKRARAAAGDIELTAPMPDPPSEDLAALIADAGATAGALTAVAAELRGRAEAGAKERAGALDEAIAQIRAVVPEDVDVPAADPREALEYFRSFARDLHKDATVADERVKTVARDLEQRRSLEKEAETHRARRAVYAALALELRGDRIVDYLQGEALTTLAAAGSDRLDYLSGGRYRLAISNDEFYVIDAWNGDEQRSVKTLSGGETFLASLALALALSDEVKNLAVSDRAPIESLFLDEGFGTLDAETLEVVVSAIEQLGGDGRMVGVITHVSELADRLPVRLSVKKSPRGSTVARDETELALALVG